MTNEAKSKKELIEYINELKTQVNDLSSKLEDTKTKLEKSTSLVVWYEEQFRLYQHQRFGSKSENIAPSQLNLFNEAERESDEQLEEPVLKEATVEEIKKKSRKPKIKREVLYTGLSVERVEHHLSDQSCPQCQSPLHVIIQEVSRRLKVIPAKVVVIEEAYDICGCRNCEHTEIHTPIIKAPMPKQAIPNSIASSSMIAYVMEQKYVNSMPLYRQEKQFKRWGVKLSCQNLANWMVKGSEWLEPLYNWMHDMIIQKDIIHADETTLQVLKEPGKVPSSKSYMWLYRTGRVGPSIVLYEYQSSRQGLHPEKFLKGFSGYL